VTNRVASATAPALLATRKVTGYTPGTAVSTAQPDTPTRLNGCGAVGEAHAAMRLVRSPSFASTAVAP
jgi:hypothetical protein